MLQFRNGKSHAAASKLLVSGVMGFADKTAKFRLHKLDNVCDNSNGMACKK